MRYTNEDIRTDMDWDVTDAWGSVQGALFDLCDAWYDATGECLAGYRPGALFDGDEISHRARMWAGFMKMGDFTGNQVHYWFKVLNRLQSLVKMAGREY
jgi:hypothetical protein